MKTILRCWPVFVAALTLIATIGLSIRSWHTHDIVVFNRGKDAFPSITIFTFSSCIRGKISDDLHSFEFSEQSIPKSSGWHQFPSRDDGKGEYPWGRFHFKTPWNPPYYVGQIFAGAPIWLVFFPGYVPLILWWLKRRKIKNDIE